MTNCHFVVSWFLQVFFLITLLDDTNSGSLNCANLRRVLTESMKENGVIFDEEQIRQLVGVLIEECIGRKHYCSESTRIAYKDMKRLLDKQKGLAAAIGGR